jgi:hypothetical protein
MRFSFIPSASRAGMANSGQPRHICIAYDDDGVNQSEVVLISRKSYGDKIEFLSAGGYPPLDEYYI